MTTATPGRRTGAGPAIGSAAASRFSAHTAAAALSLVVALGAVIATSAGLFWNGPTGPSTFTTLRGEVVDLYGHGLYRHDSLFTGAGYRGTDIVTLLIGVPLLLAAVAWFRRGSLRGTLLLSGILTYMLYVYGSMSLGAAFNGLFPLYVVLFSSSLFALGLTLREVDPDRLKRAFTARAPHRATGIFLLAAGTITAVVWLMPLVGEMVKGNPPNLLDSYTTVVTDALDLGIITPLLFLSGVLILRRVTLGYLVAFPLIGIIVVLAPSIVAATISQRAAGVDFTPGEMIGPISGFTLLGLVAVGLLFRLLHSIDETDVT